MIDPKKPIKSQNIESIIMHPMVFSQLIKSIESWSFFGPCDQIYGIKTIQDPYVPCYAKKWVFPVDRFTTYEVSDEAWARPIRYGRLEDDFDVMIAYAISRPKLAINSIEMNIKSPSYSPLFVSSYS